jgi:predicted amidohydrolase
MSSSKKQQIGRPVRIVSFSFRDKTLEEVCKFMDKEVAKGCDLVALPEIWTGEKAESLESPAITAMASMAKRHQTYIVCPVYQLKDSLRFNSAILFDRQGRIVSVYDKVFPYWGEFDLRPTTEIGRSVSVIKTDFGRLGLATCFDVNFPIVWQSMAEQGAELVIWPSAYSAGSSLKAHAINHHYYIVSSTLVRDCLAFDITGELLLDEKNDDVNISRLTLDLDRGIYHENFNLDKRDRLLKEHGDQVFQEKSLEREQWFVLRAKQAGVSARELARQYGLEELRDYKLRSHREIDKRRGTPTLAESHVTFSP